MKAKPVVFRGASGRKFLFHACAFELPLKNVGAVYALTNRTIESDGKELFRVIHLGQTDELGKAIAKHREEMLALAHECDSVCVHLERDAMKRISKIDDLSRYYSCEVVVYAPRARKRKSTIHNQGRLHLFIKTSSIISGRNEQKSGENSS